MFAGLNILSKNDLDNIIDEGIALLKNPGIRVYSESGLKLLGQAGAQINWSDYIASIPQDLIDESLKSVPSEITLYSMDNIPIVNYKDDLIHFDPGSTAIAILDRKSGKQRVPLTNDFIEFVKLVELLPQIDAQSTAIVCSDVPEEIADLYRLYLALRVMQKPIITGAFRKETWKVMFEMLVTVRGDEQSLKEYPLAVFDVCPSPPLTWSDLTCQNLIDCAQNWIPVHLVSMPLAGATAPVTLAAAVVQHTAENLSGLVIHQLANSGAPLVWGGSPSAMDMRYGTTPMGDPGTWLINSAYVQIGKHLNIPTHVYMGMSDAKTIDAQCGYESMGGMIVATLIGANMISGAGMLDFESCQSLEKLVLDAELIGYCKRFKAGIDFRESPIALDIFDEMRHSTKFISHPHTRRWFRDELFFPTDVIDRKQYLSWELDGSRDAFSRARMAVDDLLAQYQRIPLAEEKSTELEKITQNEAIRYGLDKLPEMTL